MKDERMVGGLVTGEIEPQSRADEAYELIRDRILNGQLEPGAALSVPALARVLERGRSPVREAVQRLIHEGLAQHAHNRGAVVTRIAPSELPDIFEAKEPLEGIAARRAAARATFLEIDMLSQMVDKQKQFLDLEAEPSVLMKMDRDFHLMIARLSGSSTLESVLTQFTTRTHLVVPAAWTNPLIANATVREHRVIVEAIAAGDSAAAEQAAMKHTHNVCTRLVRWLSEQQTSAESVGLQSNLAGASVVG